MTAPDMAPWVGADVHYVSHGSAPAPDGHQIYRSQCRAATVTETDDGLMVGLCVMNPTGLSFPRGVEHDQDHRGPGTWHWRTDACT